MTKGGLTRGLMVELRGLEPLTSSMPWKRATNCAKAPREDAHRPTWNRLITRRRDHEILARATESQEIASSPSAVARALYASIRQYTPERCRSMLTQAQLESPPINRQDSNGSPTKRQAPTRPDNP